jgi:Fur family ferric uptake transcriptional regulator/Fur family peroxide stress response transcriptional regulator
MILNLPEVRRMSSANLRLTPQRQAVLDVLRSCYDHPTAADVLERVRRQHPGIGAATVYRSLALLVDSGEALELNLGDGASARYDGNTSHHDHVVCADCGRAIDIPRNTASAPNISGLARRTGFAITGYDLQFHGRCPDCRKQAHTSQPD